MNAGAQQQFCPGLGHGIGGCTLGVLGLGFWIEAFNCSGFKALGLRGLGFKGLRAFACCALGR